MNPSFFSSVTLTNLKPSFSYRITVYAENGVSNISGSVASDYVIARTEASGTFKNFFFFKYCAYVCVCKHHFSHEQKLVDNNILVVGASRM